MSDALTTPSPDDSPATDDAIAPEVEASAEPARSLSRVLSRKWDLLGSRRWWVATAAGLLLALLVAVKLVVFPTPHGEALDLAVADGASVAEVVDELSSKGVVPSAFVLKLWIVSTGSTKEILPGEYRFRRGTPYGEVVAALKKGTNIPTVQLVIPEGFNVRQIARRLDLKTQLDGAKFERLAFARASALKTQHAFLKTVTTDSLEGFLFPKTYPVREDLTEEELLSRMVAQFGKDTSGLPWSRAGKLGLTPYQIVTVASMIEKETSKASERRRVAGVIYNRLNEGLPPADEYGPRLKRLQIDATVLYALGRDSGGLKASEYRLHKEQYKDFRYNTYIVDGLPPGPICSPGAGSIYAALVPEDNDYFFYVAKGDGSHEFASTWEEFKAIKQRLGYVD